MPDEPIEAPPNLTDEEVKAIIGDGPPEAPPPGLDQDQLDVLAPPYSAEPAQPEPTAEELRSQLAEAEKAKAGILKDLTATRRQQRDLAEKYDVLAQNFAQWTQAPAQPAPQDDEVDDPLTRIERNQTEQAQQIAQFQQAQAVQAQQHQQMVQIAQASRAAEEAFAKEHEDYGDAISFAKDHLRGYFQTAYGMTEQQASQAVAQEELRMVSGCLRDGGDPAEEAYKLAHQMGYQPKQTKPNGGQDPTAQPRTAPTSLSDTAGTAGARFDLASLAETDPKKFQEIAADPERWHKYMVALGHPDDDVDIR
jgi:hypothetical protein